MERQPQESSERIAFVDTLAFHDDSRGQGDDVSAVQRLLVPNSHLRFADSGASVAQDQGCLLSEGGRRLLILDLEGFRTTRVDVESPHWLPKGLERRG